MLLGPLPPILFTRCCWSFGSLRVGRGVCDQLAPSQWKTNHGRAGGGGGGTPPSMGRAGPAVPRVYPPNANTSFGPVPHTPPKPQLDCRSGSRGTEAVDQVAPFQCK